MSLDGMADRSRFREKQWSYAIVIHTDLVVAVAVVSLKFASKAFAYVFDRNARKMVYENAWLGAPWAARFDDRGAGDRSSRFAQGKIEVSVGDRSMRLHDGATRLELALHAMKAPPLGAIADAEPGRLCVTEKRVALAQGEVRTERQRYVLDGSLVGLDHSLGFAPRRTTWRWALANIAEN
jgi:hypothetical protein